MPRPRKSEATRETQQTLTEAAVYASKLIRDVARGKTMLRGRLIKMPRVAASRLFAAKIAIEHAIGLPKAKINIKTDALTMKDIAEIAADFGTNPTEIDPESDDVLVVPTKPLTARQLKERARN